MNQGTSSKSRDPHEREISGDFFWLQVHNTVRAGNPPALRTTLTDIL